MSSSRRSRSRRWKKVLGNLVIVVLGILALLLLVGLFLPRIYRVQRVTTIRATPDAVYTQLAGLRHWPEWTVWNQELDPGARIEFESPETGTGAAYHWSGAKLGRGRLRLTKAEPNKGVWYDLDFDGGKLTAIGALTLEPAGDAVKVVWWNEGDVGRNPVSRYVGLFMDRLLGPDMEQGLARLRAKLEGGGNPEPPKPSK